MSKITYKPTIPYGVVRELKSYLDEDIDYEDLSDPKIITECLIRICRFSPIQSSIRGTIGLWEIINNLESKNE